MCKACISMDSLERSDGRWNAQTERYDYLRLEVMWEELMEECWTKYERAQVVGDAEPPQKKSRDRDGEVEMSPNAKEQSQKPDKDKAAKARGSSSLPGAIKVKGLYDKASMRARRIIEAIEAKETGWAWASGEVETFKKKLAVMTINDDFAKRFLITDPADMRRDYAEDFESQCTTFVTKLKPLIDDLEKESSRLTAMQRACVKSLPHKK